MRCGLRESSRELKPGRAKETLGGGSRGNEGRWRGQGTDERLSLPSLAAAVAAAAAASNGPFPKHCVLYFFVRWAFLEARRGIRHRREEQDAVSSWSSPASTTHVKIRHGTRQGLWGKAGGVRAPWSLNCVEEGSVSTRLD